MNEFSLDTQVQTESCPHCGTEFPIRSGNVLLDNQPIGFHAAALHGCQERLLFMAIVLGDEDGSTGFFFKGWPAEDTLKLQVTDPEESPFVNLEFDGQKLTRDQAVTHRLVEIAVFVVQEISQQEPVRDYLTAQADSSAD